MPRPRLTGVHLTAPGYRRDRLDHHHLLVGRDVNVDHALNGVERDGGHELVVGGLLAVLLVVGGVALSIPAVRQRLKSRRPNGEQEEWIT